MKVEYFKNFIHTKEVMRSAYDAHLIAIQAAFERLKLNHHNHNSYLLEKEIMALKELRDMKPKDKQPIYKCMTLHSQIC